MTHAVRNIEDILLSTKLNSQSDDGSYRNFVDRLVVPGMLLQLTNNSGVNAMWNVGPGLVYVPVSENQNANKKCKKQSFILVRQFGVLKYNVTSRNDDAMVSKPKSKPNVQKQEHYIWLERLISTGSVTALLPLSRSNFRCHVGQFQLNDRVIGVVVRKAGENFLVDIGCATSATLHHLAFEGATKKNRPDIHSGDVLYAMITKADRDLDVELSCVDEVGKSSGMGILGRHEPGTVGNASGLDGGILLYCTPDLIRRLSNQNDFPYLQMLAKVFPFEICLGTNGRIWLTARSPRETMLLANCLAIAEHLSASECYELAKELC